MGLSNQKNTKNTMFIWIIDYYRQESIVVIHRSNPLDPPFLSTISIHRINPSMANNKHRCADRTGLDTHDIYNRVHMVVEFYG